MVFQTDQGINAFDFVLGQLGNAEAVHECVEIRRLVGDPAIEPVQNDTGDLVIGQIGGVAVRHRACVVGRIGGSGAVNGFFRRKGDGAARQRHYHAENDR